ncbi:hypothetical protein DCAR_0312886 [Daucus carota subsp. sativus]|uniref:4Fe-4S ferredoxin-type domain-containing protein n=1 Tax=Daucus carota subsp. sativus TaxID=79200 RepID=A0AAF1AVC9_DAUCS|nr:hypothetical protein DCAR_0312886 [Daucus carota subsp. sativus]
MPTPSLNILLRFRGRIHFEFDNCIAYKVCVRVCPIDLPVVDWKLETDTRKKRLLNYSLPENLFLLDIAGQLAFLIDIVIHFFVAYWDSHSHSLVFNHNRIAIRSLSFSSLF